MKRIPGCVALFLLAAPLPALAQRTEQLARELEAFQVTERLGAVVPGSLRLTREDGTPMALFELTGRPVLLTFNYVGCPMLCSLQLAGLAKALKDQPRFRAGRDYAVLTVSIDPKERLPQLLRFKQGQVRLAGGTPEVSDAWRFAVGAPDALEALTRAVGFGYRYDAKTGEFHHQATVVVLTPGLTVSSYLHGVSYPAAELDRALERAGAGEVLTPSEQSGLSGFLMACFQYAPHRGGAAGLWAVRVSGVLVLAGLGLLLSGQWRRFLRDKQGVGDSRET